MNYVLSPKLIIAYILVVSVIMDIAFGVLEYYGLSFIRLSLVYRVSILLVFFVVLMRQADAEAWYVKSILLLWLLSMSVWIVVQGDLPIILDVIFFLKTLFPLCIAFIVSSALQRAYLAGDNIEESVLSGIVAYGIIASISIIFSFLTGLGRNTYGGWAFGIKSFFTGGNDIGLTMLVSLVFAWVFLWRKVSFIHLVLVLILIFSIPLIGSRASWAGGAGVTVAFALAFLLFKRKGGANTTMVRVLILSVALVLTVYAAKFVDDNIEDIAFNIRQVNELMEGVSPRVKLQHAGSAVLEQRSPVLDAFGQGTSFFYKVYNQYYLGLKLPEGTEHYKAVEQDLLDLFGMYGYLLGSAFLLYHIYYWVAALRNFMVRQGILCFGYFFALSLFLFHGLLAGHAMSSPQVGTLIGSIYGLMRFRRWRLNTVAAQ